MIKTKFNKMIINIKDVKSELGHLIDLNNVNKMVLNNETAERLKICITSLKEHIKNLNSIKDSYEKELESYKAEKLSILKSKGVSRSEYLKTKGDLLKYDDGKELTLVERMTSKDVNYINYKSSLKVYNLFMKELKANEKLLAKYQNIYIKCVENYNKTFSKIDNDLKNNIVSSNNLKEVVGFIAKEKGELDLVNKFESLSSLDKKEVAIGLVSELTEELKLNLAVKKLLKIDDNYPKVIKDLLNKVNEMLTKNDFGDNIKLIKEQLILDVTIENFQIRKVLKDGASQLKVMKFGDSLVPLYSSDSNSWLNEGERKEFYVKALDFIENKN